ncbi:MAG: peptidylprolyl isomerase, partial [Planctomycetota bacterium]|nr:peptidylprolyl isomerase [Planctomycetota bacterium]
EAQAAGVVATDSEVLDRIKTRVGYWSSRGEKTELDENAPFDRTAYQQMLRRYDMTTATFERTLRESILVEKYQQAMLSIVRPNDLERRAEFEKERAQLKAKYLSFRSDEFSELTEPTEEQVQEYFEENNQADAGLVPGGRKQSGKYYQPNRVAIEYVYANFKDIQFELKAGDPLPYARVEKYYYTNRDDYKNSDDDVKKGRPRYKSISEVYHEVVNKITETEAKHIARSRMASVLNSWGETASIEMEDLDTYLQTLAEKYKVRYRGRTQDVSNREMNDSTVGPIARASQVQAAAFKIYQSRSDGKPMSSDDVLTYTSDLLESTDGVYVLRVVSQKPSYRPSWKEIQAGSVPNLDYEKLKDDLKVENGFQQARKEALKMRQAIYAMTVSTTARALGLSVQEVEANEDGTIKPDLGEATATINRKIFKADIGDIVLPFEAATKRYMLLVTGGTEARRQARAMTLDDDKLKAHEFSPSEALLEEHYETVKTGPAYKNPDKVEAEILQARNASFEGDGQKARAALEAVAKDEVVTKEATTTKEKADQKDKIKELAEKSNIRYGKNLDSFEVGDNQAMTKQLGTGIANAIGLATALDKAEEGKWSEIKDSLEGPFMIRVVSKTPGGPADFKDVRQRVKEDFLSGWKDRASSDQFALLWQEQLNASLGKVDTLDPIVKKTTKTFGARSSEYFVASRAPARFEDDKGVADAIRALKQGQLSGLLESENSFVIGMVRDEKTEKKVAAKYIEVAVDDFKPAPDAIKDEDLKAHYETNKRTAPAEVEIEYVTADIATLKAEIEKGLTSADKTDYFNKHLSDYYKGLDIKTAEPAVINDLSDERASSQAQEKILEAYDIVRKAAQKGDNSFEKLGERDGLTYKKVKFSRNNVHKVAAHLGSLQGHPQKAMAMANGDISKPVRTSTDYFIFRRLALTPARELPLDEVKEDVIKAVQAKKALAAAKAWVASVVTASKGKSLDDGLKAAEYPEGMKAAEVLRTVPFGATTSLSSVPSGDFRDAAVKLQKGDVFGPFESENTVLAGAISDVTDE